MSGGRFDRGGGGYQRDNRRGGGGGGGGGGYQQRGGLNKRGREEESQVDPVQLLITKLMTLGDQTQELGGDNESAFEEALKLCVREVDHKKEENLIEILLDCVVEVPTKTPHYALLAGLLNVEEPHLLSSLVSSAHAALSSALSQPLIATVADGGVSPLARARLILRFLSALAVVNVVNASGLLAAMEGIVAAAVAAATGASDPSGATWQPWSDQLVYLVLAALPWAGVELAEGGPAEVQRLWEAIEAYMASRPVADDDQTRPFFGSLGPEDMAARSDSGSASFLSDLWEAVKQCQAEGWKIASIPQLHGAYEERVARASAHDLPPLDVPQAPPLASELDSPPPIQVAAILRKAIPPRGGIRLLPKDKTEGSRAPIERFVAEEYILDTMVALEGSRVHCIKRLVSGLPLEKGWEHQALLAEVLFSQMLTLPSSRLHPMAYCTLLVDLCKVPRFDFTRPLSGCVRELFSRLPHMDPELRTRFVAWLSYHLSNFDFTWPWDRWAWVTELPPDAAQRQFCHELLGRLVRLSFWKRIHQVLPPQFQELLGPAPSVPDNPGAQVTVPIPPSASSAPPTASAEGAEGGDGAAGGEGPVEDTKMDQSRRGEGDVPPADASAATAPPPSITTQPPSRSLVLAGRLLRLIKDRVEVQEAKLWLQDNVVCHSGDGDADEGMMDSEMDETASAKLRLKVAMRALLAAGARSPSHLAAVLKRYAVLLEQLLGCCRGEPADASDEDSDDGAQRILMYEAAEFYREVPQKVLMVVDQLTALGLLSPTQLVLWALQPEESADDGNLIPSSGVWEALYYGLGRAYSSLPHLLEQVERLESDVSTLKAKAESASDYAADVGEAMPAPTADNEHEIRGALARIAAANKDELAMRDQVRSAQSRLDACHVAVTECGSQASRALLAAFRCLASLIGILERKSTEMASAAAEDIDGGGDGLEEPDVTTRASASAAAAARVEVMYQHLRVFARRFRGEAAEASQELFRILEGSVPERMRKEVLAVLHLDLLAMH